MNKRLPHERFRQDKVDLNPTLDIMNLAHR